jgi:hypothetical protein
MFRKSFPVLIGMLVGSLFLGGVEGHPLLQRTRACVPAKCRVGLEYQTQRNAKCGAQALDQVLANVVEKAEAAAAAPKSESSPPRDLAAILSPIVADMQTLELLVAKHREDIEALDSATQEKLAQWGDHVLTFESPELEREQQAEHACAAQVYSQSLSCAHAHLARLDAALGAGRDLQRLATSLTMKREVLDAAGQLDACSAELNSKLKNFSDACRSARQQLDEAGKPGR